MTAPAPTVHPALARAAQIAVRLAEVIENENEALAQHRPGSLSGTEEAKTTLSLTYHEAMEELRANPELVKAASPAEVEELRAAGTRLNGALDAQRRRVVAARRVTERILDAITEEVERRRFPVRQYDRSAAVSRPSRRGARPAPTAVVYHEIV